MAEQLNRKLRATASQGSSDAFCQVAINTTLSNAVPMGMLLKRACVDLSASSSVMAIGTDFAMEFALTKVTKAAMPTLSDVDVIARNACAVLLTTSGKTYMPLVWTLDMAPGELVVQDQLFFQFDTAGTGVGQSANIVIDYELVKLSEVDFLRLLASS